MAEGTVYFKTSPALEGVQEVARASFSAESLREGPEEKESSGATVAALGAHSGSPLWKRLLRVVWREENSSCTSTEVTQTVSAILQSGLLNEEHYHLVATVMRASQESKLDDRGRSCKRAPDAPSSSLADEIAGIPTASTAGSGKEQPLVPSTAPLPSQCHQRSSMDDTRTALLLSGAAVLVLLPLWWASPTLFTLTFLLPASAAAAVLCVWRWSQRKATERGVAQVMSYVEGFDRLLCLVAESIRYLQEMEALSKGYTRYSVIGGHFSQVGGAEMGVSHCVVLRRTLHQVVGTLNGGVSTCVLSNGTCLVGLAPSMEAGRSHLVREEELGLAELKEQCHTMAVGNSRMLRDLSLSLMSFPLEGVPERATDPLHLLRTLSPSLQKLTMAVKKGHGQLKWALGFEEVYCSEPEGCMKGLVKASGCGPSPSPSPLSESLLRGLHGMDLKGQLVVRGVRDCVRLLQDDLDFLPQVEAHLLALQTHLSALNTDLTEALQMLQPATITDTEHSAGSDSSSDRDGTQPSRPLEAMSPDGSPLSSDEEKVYEAYVPKLNDLEEEWPTGEGNPECTRGWSDLPIKMVNELKNVLSLRELQRMERRAMRRRKRKRVADEQTDRQTDGLTDGLHGLQTMQCSPSSPRLPSDMLNNASAVGNPPVKKETAVRSPASLSSPPSTGLPAGSSLRENPVVGVSAPPSVNSVGESVSELQAVSSLVALLARQQRSPQKEECFGDSSGSEQDM